MLDGGWVKIYRKIWDNPWLRKPNFLAVWVWLLSHVEYRDEKDAASVIWEGKRYWLKKGEIACGMIQIANEIGISRSTVIRALDIFTKDGQIEQQSSSKFSLIKVKNWEQYQDTRTTADTTSGQRLTQQVDTYRKNIRIKEVKNNESEHSLPLVPTPKDLAKSFFSDPSVQETTIRELGTKMEMELARQEVAKFARYWTELDKTGRKQKWELEKTFEVSKRLATWIGNLPAFSSSNRKQASGGVVTLRDGSKAKLHFGRWVDADNPNVAIDLHYYPELNKQ